MKHQFCSPEATLNMGSLGNQSSASSLILCGHENFPEISRKVLRMPKVCEKTGLSRTDVYEAMKHGFPKQIRLGKRSVGWVESEIDQWIASRMGESK